MNNVNVNVNVVGLSIVKWSLPEAAERAEATSRELFFLEEILCDNEGGEGENLGVIRRLRLPERGLNQDVEETIRDED